MLGAGRELETGPGAVVWALSAPQARIATHHFARRARRRGGQGQRAAVTPPASATRSIVLADPYTFSAEALLAALNAERPGMPVLGGLASAAAAGSAALFRDGEVLDGGAVAASLDGVDVIPCVSQGATPIGPEMTITAASGNLIQRARLEARDRAPARRRSPSSIRASRRSPPRG